MSDKPNLTPDEAAEMLEDLLAKDREIEDIKRQLVGAKATYDDVKAHLKDAQEARDKLSWEIRNPPPLFDRPATTTADQAKDDLHFCGEFTPTEEEATRAFVEERREGEWDLDGAPISPEAMPKLTGPPKKRRPGRKAAAQA